MTEKTNPEAEGQASGEAVATAAAESRRLRDTARARLGAASFKWRWVLLTCVSVYAVVLIAVGGGVPQLFRNPLFWIVLFPGGFVLALYSYWSVLAYYRLFLRISLRFADYRVAEAGVSELQESLEEDFFTKLVKINFKYIDQYYLQTQSQADKSFVLTAVVAGIGVVIIATGIVLMYLGKTQPAYVSTAAGVLSEFTAGVFFYLYNRTVIKMGEYHQKLVFTQNVGLALKISEGLPASEKTAAQRELITSLSKDVNLYLSLSAPPHTNRK